jgi:aryl sulfotransferase
LTEVEPRGAIPERSRVYQNHHFDSTRWDYFESRPDDVVIATSYKAGTTWMQSIVAHLIFQTEELPAPLAALSPWLDMRLAPLESVLNGLKAQQHRRFIKTHLPLDGLQLEERLKYVYVARDARDVFMSLWNHYKNHTDEMFDLTNRTPDRVGDEFPRPPEDIHDLWRSWITRGWFEWETDGWPYWSHLYSVQSWWDYRHLPNILLVHYADLALDTEREVTRVAEFLEIDVPAGGMKRIVNSVSFAEMKKRAPQYAPGEGGHWKGGADTFLNKGVNGRWRDVLSQEELEQYEAACARALTPDCRRWLEDGGLTS